MSYRQKYRAGDPNNSHDPAALTGDRARDNAAAQQRMANDPAMMNLMEKMTFDPSMMEAFVKMMKDDMEDAERRGETMEERVVREKREFAQDDSLSEKLKVKVCDLRQTAYAESNLETRETRRCGREISSWRSPTIRLAYSRVHMSLCTGSTCLPLV